MSGNAWIIIGAIATVIAAVSIPYGFYIKDIEKGVSSGTSDVNVQGDYVAGNKIINIGPSETDLEEIVRKVAKEFRSPLSNKYPEGYAVFGIKKNNFVVPKGLVPEGVDISWDTGEVRASDQEIKITIPDMVINTKQIRNVRFLRNTITLPKQVSNRVITPFILGNIGIELQVIGIDKDLIVVGLGFRLIETKK